MPAKTTPAERKALAAEKALATRIAKMRDAGENWSAVKSAVGIASAVKGRALLRKHGLDETRGGKSRIAPSYERTAEFKAAESARRTAEPEPVKPARKPRKKVAK